MNTYLKLRRAWLRTIVVLLSSVLMLSSLSVHAKSKHHHFSHNPLIFVHGGAGSASQFESQAMRLTSNGYPQSYLHVLEYDSSFSVDTMITIHARLDALIASVREQTGAEKVDLMGHSLGTYVSMLYLNSAASRAENVAHFVNLDGYPAATLPGGVPTLALWAEIGQGGHVVGATNVVIEGQTHVETATSAESFAHIYAFLTGSHPKTTYVLPSRGKHITVAGRASLFPQNIGVDGSTVEIYEVDADTGKRKQHRAKVVFNIDSSGDFGPFKAKKGQHYEFVIVRDGQNHHVYKEAFSRDDYFVRLLTSAVGGGVGANVHVDEGQSNLIISRDREFLGELPLGNDLLVVNGVNVITPTNSPFSNRTNVIYLFDEYSDQQSNFDEPLAYFHGLPFITGNDFYLPSSLRGEDRIRITSIPRGGNGEMKVINVPNWPSTTDRITVQFNDFIQRQ